MIIRKISEVSKSLAKVGIAKLGRNKHAGFNFRGIDQIYEAVGPELVKHGVIIFPQAVKWTVSREPTGKDDKQMRFVMVDVTYAIACGDQEGEMILVQASGEAFDAGDKALNKAMSGAYKNMVFQTFCPPFKGFNFDSEDDSEADEVVAGMDLAEAVKVENFLSESRYAALPQRFGVEQVTDIPMTVYLDQIRPQLIKEGMKV